MTSQTPIEVRRSSLERRSRRLNARIDALQRRSSSLSWVRLVVVLAAVALTVGIGFIFPPAAVFTLVLGALIFGIVVAQHRAVDRTLQQMRTLRHLYETHLARTRLDWQGLPSALPDAPSPQHPFELDLDITGERSLHRLLDTAVTVEGSTRLRGWLLEPRPDREVVLKRQTLARELTAQPRFRDKLEVFGRQSAATGKPAKRWRSAALVEWLVEPTPNDGLPRFVRLLGVLAALDIVLFLLNAAAVLPPLWIASWVVYLALVMSRPRISSEVFEEAAALQDALRRTQPVFAFLERYPYRTDDLRALCAPFLSADRPSAALRRLGWLVAAASLQANFVLDGIVNAVIPWDLFIALRLRRTRRVLAERLPRWMETWWELEALSALATFADLNPTYTAPQIADVPARWTAVGLGHPLIPHERRVTNDLTLQAIGKAALITGSNMSGKSTFLRTVGVNMALAYAGAVVCAEHFDLSVFRLFTSMRIDDSLAEGVSYFYAEVRRLKALIDALGETKAPPLFFLIDEIFRGTNNRERFLGSQAVVLALVNDGRAPAHGVGLISTHDLELTRLAGERIHNYHFADHVEAGRIHFDYRLREGPSFTTNALKIMALEGLPVLSEVSAAENRKS